MHAFTRPAATLAQHQDHGKSSCTCIDMYNRATSKIERSELGQPSAAEDPVRNRCVHEHKPESDEDAVGLELESVCGSAGDECWRDYSKRHLIRAEKYEWDRERKRFVAGRRIDVAHPREIKVADESTVTEVSECQRECNRHPNNRHQAHGKEVLHEHAENVLCSNHAAIKEGQARRHEQHQSR